MNNVITINVPKEYTYLSEVPEIRTTYNNDLPHNAVIDKQVTGVGGTHIVLTNKEPYIVAVHMLRMIENKVNQDKYKHVFPVTGETSAVQIEAALKSGCIKFMTTYDSVPRLQSILGNRSKDFRLLVDEFHKLIQYLNKFKPSVSIKLLGKQKEFKSVSYMTATPTNFEYLPAPMKELDVVEFKWENARTPNLSHSYITKNITEAVLSTTLDILDNTENEVYIFYNSRRNVVALIKKLLTCKPELHLNDINVLFSESKENTSFFKKNLGNSFKYGEFPNGRNNKRVNIISSMGYEGSDFFSNDNPDIKPISLVVSDPTSKTMRFDISIDLTQIIGRFRANNVTGLIENHPVIYLWNTQNTDYIKDESTYKSILIDLEKEANEAIDIIKTNKTIYKSIDMLATSEQSLFLIKEEDNIVLHPYGYEAGMAVYHAMHSDSYVLNNIDEEGQIKKDSIVVSKLANLNPDLNTFEVPILNSTYTKLLGRNPSVIKLIAEFSSLLEKRREVRSEEELEEVQQNFTDFLILNTEFASWLDAGITISEMNSVGRTRDKVNNLMVSKLRLAKSEVSLIEYLKIEVGSIATKKQWKENIQKYYDYLGALKKAKATDLNEFCVMRETRRLVDDQIIKLLVVEEIL